MTPINQMASMVLASLKDDADYLSFVAARWHEEYEAGEDAHNAWLTLYLTPPYDKPYGSMCPDVEPDDLSLILHVSPYKGSNKQFIAALRKILVPNFIYPSMQLRFGFDKVGYYQESESFDIADLQEALVQIATSELHKNDISEQTPVNLVATEAQLRDVLRGYYDSLEDDDDMTIYFTCDLDEDWSSADDQVYQYTGHCVKDSNFDIIAYVNEEVFDLCFEGEFVGDIETQMYEVTLEEWLGNRPRFTKALSPQQRAS